MTPEELLAGMARERERLLRAIAGVSEEQFKRRPPAEPNREPPWCIAEVLSHLLASERRAAARIRAAIEQDGARIEQVTPGEEQAAARAGRSAPVPQLIHGLLASRRELERLTGFAAPLPGGLDRSVVYADGGSQSIAALLWADIIGHEADHCAQIEDLRAQAGAPPIA